MPQLQQLSISMSPQWAASLNEAQRMRRGSCIVLGLLQDQLSATKACLQSLSRRAPNLRALSVIDDGTLRGLPSSFSMLTHVVLDRWDAVSGVAWVRELPQLKTLKVNACVQYTWWLDLDLRAMTSLEFLSITRHVFHALKLPGACQVHVGDASPCQIRSLENAPWLPQLTRVEIAVKKRLIDTDYNCSFLRLDLHLDDLTLRYRDIGLTDEEPILIPADSCPLLNQAKHVTLYAENIRIQIASDATLAWRKVRMIADRQLTLTYKEPEALLEGRTAIVLQYLQTNIHDPSVMWRPIAERLGLSITTSQSESEGKIRHRLCLSTGSTEDQEFMQAPCVCHACMECLAYYDMLK